MIGFDDGKEIERWLDDNPVKTINSDLTTSLDLTSAKLLQENGGISFQGPSPKGPFDIDYNTAKIHYRTLLHKHPQFQHLERHRDGYVLIQEVFE